MIAAGGYNKNETKNLAATTPVAFNLPVGHNSKPYLDAAKLSAPRATIAIAQRHSRVGKEHLIVSNANVCPHPRQTLAALLLFSNIPTH